MKRVVSFFLLILLSLNMTAQTYQPTEENLLSRRDFENRRFGIFLHWGLYSMFGQGEWYLNYGLSAEEYAKSMNAFYPHSFDAQEWVKAFKDAGAGYICFTSRHHDGFSMWNSKASDFNIMHTPYGRDIVGQLAKACHKEGLRLHLYYSHLDWSRPDYPWGSTGRSTGRDSSLQNWPKYYEFMNSQLRELLTNYGRIDCIWFDGWWDHGKDAEPFDWQLKEQYEMIHKLQPWCLIGNNHHQSPFEGEDIQLFERDVPGENKAGFSGQAVQNGLPLETCQTMNGMWGYKIKDQNYKSVTELVRLLVRTSAKGANLLLNIGPQPDGRLPKTALSRLKGIGQWLRLNGHTIYGTRAGGITIGQDIVSTRNDKEIFLHCLCDTIPTEIVLPSGRVVRPERGGQKNECDYIITLKDAKN